MASREKGKGGGRFGGHHTCMDMDMDMDIFLNDLFFNFFNSPVDHGSNLTLQFQGDGIRESLICSLVPRWEKQQPATYNFFFSTRC